jgi:hypothetical protein
LYGTSSLTYICHAEDLQKELKKSFPNGLPPNAKLFSVDAVGMYKNIDTPHGIEVLTRWLTDHRDELPRSTPSDFLIAALNEIMSNNIIQFGDTYWHQLRGCAMGNSAAVNYAYLYVGLLEVRRLLPCYKESLLFFRRFIDDGIGVWIDQPGDLCAWRSFFACLNRWGTLKWTCEGHVDSLIFLDLNISIGADCHLVSSTYQKEMNLYLYIPLSSAHPKNMLRGLVFGRLRAYWIQNTAKSNYTRMASLLARRLMARGYTLEQLLPLFTEADARLQLQMNPKRQDTNAQPQQATPEPLLPIIFHLKYYPRGLQRAQIHSVYAETMAPLLEAERKLIIAVSRPKHLRDRVCTTRLPNVKTDNPSDYIVCGDNSHSPQILPES